MTPTEIIFMLAGTCAVMFFGVKLLGLVMMLALKLCYPLSVSFFTSLGKWAVVTGGSDGIGRAYAQELSKRGMNVIIISRNQEKLDGAARSIELSTGAQVKVITADFTKDDMYGHIMKSLEDLDIGILVNNVGILPSKVPCRLLETADLEKKIYDVINCNVKAMVKMCRIVLPGMQERGRGVILNVSSGIAKIPCPMYTLYAASKVFVERFHRVFKRIINPKELSFRTVAPFGVSTSMTGFQRPDMVTFTAEEFVKSSLKYLKAGDLTYGSLTHAILGWIVQAIPTWVLQSEMFQYHFKKYVSERMEK